eukprot:Clim_evm64s108 gene=Clim_evmTU64s108
MPQFETSSGSFSFFALTMMGMVLVFASIGLPWGEFGGLYFYLTGICDKPTAVNATCEDYHVSDNRTTEALVLVCIGGGLIFLGLITRILALGLDVSKKTNKIVRTVASLFYVGGSAMACSALAPMISFLRPWQTGALNVGVVVVIVGSFVSAFCGLASAILSYPPEKLLNDKRPAVPARVEHTYEDPTTLKSDSSRGHQDEIEVVHDKHSDIVEEQERRHYKRAMKGLFVTLLLIVGIVGTALTASLVHSQVNLQPSKYTVSSRSATSHPIVATSIYTQDPVVWAPAGRNGLIMVNENLAQQQAMNFNELSDCDSLSVMHVNVTQNLNREPDNIILCMSSRNGAVNHRYQLASSNLGIIPGFEPITCGTTCQITADEINMVFWVAGGDSGVVTILNLEYPAEPYNPNARPTPLTLTGWQHTVDTVFYVQPIPIDAELSSEGMPFVLMTTMDTNGTFYIDAATYNDVTGELEFYNTLALKNTNENPDVFVQPRLGMTQSPNVVTFRPVMYRTSDGEILAQPDTGVHFLIYDGSKFQTFYFDTTIAPSIGPLSEVIDSLMNPFADIWVLMEDDTGEQITAYAVDEYGMITLSDLSDDTHPKYAFKYIESHATDTPTGIAVLIDVNAIVLTLNHGGVLTIEDYG